MARPSHLAEDLVTVEEFHRLAPDGQKADLIDGVIYMASPDSLRANELTGFVYRLLTDFLEARDLGGKVVFGRFAFELSEIRAPEPDVAYVRPEREHLMHETRMRGGPDIAVEVVSRESRNRDYGEKDEFYRDAEVLEYWIVDPLQKRVEFRVLQDSGYVVAALEDNRRFHSRMLPDFWLEVDWLLADPLPKVTDCLSRVLAGK